MNDNKLELVGTPEEIVGDPLTALLRNGAKALIAQAVEVELEAILVTYQHEKLVDGRQAIVRNGYLPERTIQTGVGDVAIKVPKVRDRSGARIHFSSGPQELPFTKSEGFEYFCLQKYFKIIRAFLSTGGYKLLLHFVA